MLFSLGSCGHPRYVNVFGLQSPSSNALNIQVSLNDTVFSCREINQYIDYFRFPPTTDTHPISVEAANALHRPIFKVIIENPSAKKLILPLFSVMAEPERGDEKNAGILYRVGTDSATLELELPSGVVTSEERDPVPWLYGGRYFGVLAPGQTVVIREAVNVFDPRKTRPLYPGRYWIAVSYQNFWKEEQHREYWTGRVNADTVWFELVE